MGILGSIKNWFISLFSKAKSLIAKAWDLATPFLKQILSTTASNVISSLQTLAVEAVAYVASQGLPTDEEKQDAFVAYMKEKAEAQVSSLKTSELNLLREIALAIYKKATGTTV